jgi:hypothetical protein
MTKLTLFVQVQDKPGITEIEVTAPAEADDILRAIKAAGLEVDKDWSVFADEADEPLKAGHKGPIEGLKTGTRIHITRCKKIKVTVHFQDKTIDRAFPLGARVRAVKQWAVRELKINPTDAGEHVLQLCNSTKQPPTDTPLAELTDQRTCAVCFDLVPEKRVEG